MKLARTGIIAAAILSVASVAFAQKTDFSGTWTPEAPAAAPAAGAGGGAVVAAAVAAWVAARWSSSRTRRR